MSRRYRIPAGFSLIELLIVLTLMGVLAGVVLASSDPSFHDRLLSSAEILASDLAYARSLAVTYDSTYCVTFDPGENRYVLTHTGANTALDTLPESPVRSPDDPSNARITDLDELPSMGSAVRLEGAADDNGSLADVSDVEFSPLGGTTRSSWTVIWLSVGSGVHKRYIKLAVNPVTGLASVGELSVSGPP
jgi:prepilin-type N-terminal cleavage/methylation domain-containing protein